MTYEHDQVYKEDIGHITALFNQATSGNRIQITTAVAIEKIVWEVTN